MAKRKVVVLGVDAPDRQAVIQDLLAGHQVRFADSVETVIAHSHNADIIAVGTNHEKYLPAFFAGGFNGSIIPLLVDNQKKAMVVNGKLEPAVAVRELPDTAIRIINELKERQPLAT